MKITKTSLSLILLFTFFAINAKADPQKLVLGIPPFMSHEQIMDKYQPMLQQLDVDKRYSLELRNIGSTYEDFLINLSTENFDLLLLPGHWALPVIEKMHYQPLLRTRREYQAVIFTHENSGVNGLRDLKGQKVATLGGLSLASSVLKRVMQAQGISPVKHIDVIELENTQQVLHAVRSEQAGVGVVVELHSQQLYEEITGKLKLVAKISAGPSVVLTGEHLSEKNRQEIMQIINNLSETEQGSLSEQVAEFDGFLPLKKKDLERFRESEAAVGQFIHPSGQ